MTRALIPPCLALFLLAGAAYPQLAEKANEGYRTPEGRERVANTLDNPGREKSQKPRELIAGIGVKKGDVVADVGAGVGFMLPYLVEAVGPSGFIYAEDIQQDFLDKAQERIEAGGWKNVQTVLGDQIDPKLPAGKIDLAFVLDAYHHFEFPLDTLKSLRQSLKPDGRLAVVDFYRGRPHPTMSGERLKDHIRLDRDGFTKEIESAGFRLDRYFDHLPHQYAIIFRKTAD